MSEATEQELKDMLSATEDLSSDSLSLVLADAKKIVIGHGFAETHASFSQLQRYMAAHLLALEGRAGKAITAERVNDVSIDYSDNPSALGNLYVTNWERQYHRLKVSLIGLTNRFL